MSLSKRPSADRRILLKSSHLHGMERPVRSFKSFIRAIPPRTSSDKPLPPIPTGLPLRKTSSSSSLTTLQTRSTRLSLWEPPPSWDNDDEFRDQSTPPFAQRHYSPLIPEPPEDIAAMQADPVLWQQGHGPFQQTQLDPIHERNAATPEVPQRNPARLSLSNIATTRPTSRDAAVSISSRYSTVTIDDERRTGNTLNSPAAAANEGSSSPLDLVSALTDMTLNKQAFSASGLPSSRDQGIICDSRRRNSDFTHLEASDELDSANSLLKTFGQDGVYEAASPGLSDYTEVSTRMQAKIFAQDYHSALAESGFKVHDRSEQDGSRNTQPQDQELTPQPLSWRKKSGRSAPSETQQRPQLTPTGSSGRHRNLKMMSSWVNQRLKRDPQTRFRPDRRSVSDPGTTPQIRIPEVEVDQHLKNEARLANMVQHSKDFVSRKILRRETEPARSLLVHPADPVTTTTSFDIAKPVLRLPGGLAIVRQSSSTALRPEPADCPPSYPIPNLSWPNLPNSTLFRQRLSRRGSGQSTHSQLHDDLPPTIPAQRFSPLASPARLQAFSYSTTSLPASLPTPFLPQDSPNPLSTTQKASQTRRRSHNIASPINHLHSAHPGDSSQPIQESLESVIHKLNVFEKAKHAHDTWRKHQKEVKNERLKQSIRLVGPADAKDVAGVAGYIKCAVDGRVSGDSGVGEGRIECTGAP